MFYLPILPKFLRSEIGNTYIFYFDLNVISGHSITAIFLFSSLRHVYNL